MAVSEDNFTRLKLNKNWGGIEDMTLKQFVAKLEKGGYKVDIIPVENYTGI